MGLRTFVFNLLKDDAQLNVLGYNAETLYPTQAPDSPRANQNRFMVLAWGNAEPRLGRDADVRRQLLTVWAYDKERDFGAVNDALNRTHAILYPLAAVNVGGGWITEVLDNGQSDDLYDPEYEAVTRNWAYTIIASGN